jgi:hypothetical protein
LKEGDNRLQFSWAGTLIDPTSLSMLPKKHAGQIDIADLTFPPRVKNAGIWNIDSYMGTLAEDEQTMQLQGYVRVSNNSGEDYENAQTRLIVGKVNLLDRIAELARREQPYGRPGHYRPPAPRGRASGEREEFRLEKGVQLFDMSIDTLMESKEIKKEGLSEYFLYTIEGTETIANTWSKRLPSFDTEDIPVVNLYKHTGPGDNRVYRYLSFKNDDEHELGETPIPGGQLKVYRNVDDEAHLSYTGASNFKYIPVGEDVELNLGAVSDVIVEPKMMDVKTDNYRFDRKGNISGWDEIRTVRLTVKNTRDLDIKIELKRNLNTRYWDIDNLDDADSYFEKVDLDTVKYTLTLEPETEKVIEYVLTTYQGSRTEEWTRQNR